jgi:BirA family biotin operon repressor/biotin-[acetyl-CoA-carboxylase] ligase
MSLDLLQEWEGRPVRDWARSWEIPLLEVHGALDSTNDRVRRLADAGCEAFTTVTAEEQTEGRGRGGAGWWSPNGGLWASVLVEVEAGARGELLPLVAGLSLARAVVTASRGEVEPRIKWPNDLQVGERKLAGILCERSGEGRIVVGVGVNVDFGAVKAPAELAGVVTALSEWCTEPPTRAALLGSFISSLRAELPLSDRLARPQLEELDRLDVLKGRSVEGSAGVRGVAEGIQSDGSLCLRVDGGHTSIRSGSIRLIDERPTGPASGRGRKSWTWS